MWERQIQTNQLHPLLTFVAGGSRSRQSRLRRFCLWQETSGGQWYLPDLAAWRDQLIKEE